ncbi:hypothetical protein AXK11_08990 [Cephaloticoccus primus]|uniref:Uncharacterized protein n=1 Tax=Cephaloticoccus primus TaxID=1548207 RepID=A0A139SHV4_9BACT|nr:hypothetical protein AXK11_08990 [Cephaloticoccus primus]
MCLSARLGLRPLRVAAALTAIIATETALRGPPLKRPRPAPKRERTKHKSDKRTQPHEPNRVTQTHPGANRMVNT